MLSFFRGIEFTKKIANSLENEMLMEIPWQDVRRQVTVRSKKATEKVQMGHL